MSESRRACITIKIHPDKIREVIGKGGAVIRQITEETGTTDRHRGRRHRQDRLGQRRRGHEAKARIELITSDVEAGPHLRRQGRQA
jgi:polyribonucleotide nucleotidyltransferase